MLEPGLARTSLVDGVSPGTHHVLLVDDDDRVGRVYARMLEARGYIVHRAMGGSDAIERIARHSFDMVITDIDMPEVDGIAVLRAVRTRDADLPVILMTGNAALHSTLQAVEHGALRYLIKPVDSETLLEAVRTGISKQKLAALKQRALELYGHAAERSLVEQLLHTQLDAAIAALYMAYQPIVDVGARRVFAYEALVRSEDKVLRRPDQLLRLAENLHRVYDVDRAVRRSVASTLAAMPEPVTMFVNVHPCALQDDELFDPAAPLSGVARNVVLEITERAALDSVPDLAQRIAALRSLGYRLAIDDLGAGYAGLSAFAQIHPDVVKIDMSLIRGIDASSTRRKVVHCVIRLANELDALVVAEGVETTAERDVLSQLGCPLLQGYLFAKPAWPIPNPTW